MLQRLDVHFNPHSKSSKKSSAVIVPTDYSHNIKELLNKLISAAKSHLPEFRRLINETFTIGEEAEQRTLDSLSGMKFKEDMPLYTEDEMREPGVPIKRPEVLRVLIKWTEELDEIVANPDSLL